MTNFPSTTHRSKAQRRVAQQGASTAHVPAEQHAQPTWLSREWAQRAAWGRPVTTNTNSPGTLPRPTAVGFTTNVLFRSAASALSAPAKSCSFLPQRVASTAPPSMSIMSLLAEPEVLAAGCAESSSGAAPLLSGIAGLDSVVEASSAAPDKALSSPIPMFTLATGLAHRLFRIQQRLQALAHGYQLRQAHMSGLFPWLCHNLPGHLRTKSHKESRSLTSQSLNLSLLTSQESWSSLLKKQRRNASERQAKRVTCC